MPINYRSTSSANVVLYTQNIVGVDADADADVDDGNCSLALENCLVKVAVVL
jgi:hypothetical protein